MTSVTTAAAASLELAAGAWFHNPASGEVARLAVAPAETRGRRIEVELWLQPGAAVAGAHVHDSVIERFEVLDGEVGFQIAGDERVARPGDGVLECPPESSTIGGTRETASLGSASWSRPPRRRGARRPPASYR